MQTQQPTLQERANYEAQLAALQEENARLKAANDAKRNQKLSLKVSAKGAVSLYGLGRFPVTLYASQWERLLATAPQLQEFIQTNIASLAQKS